MQCWHSCRLNLRNGCRTLLLGHSRHGLSTTSHNFTKSQDETISPVSTSDGLDLQKLQGRRFSYVEHFSEYPSKLLGAALKAYLPPQDDVSNTDSSWMHLGHQHAYLRPILYDEMLCSDGCDDKFVPGSPDIWKYRLWAGGTVVQHNNVPRSYSEGGMITLQEQASNIRLIRQEGIVNKVFVTINRHFSRISIPDDHYEAQQTGPFTNGGTPDNGPIPENTFLTETENICFLRDRPTSLQSSRRVKPPSGPMFSHSVTPKESLLFQFSALTYNAHRIHVDREFARTEYGAKDLVVHGPLTQVLMVEFLRICLRKLSRSHRTTLVPMRVHYTNMQPMYVDEPVKFCCKPMQEPTDGAPEKTSEWQVWIEKGSGDESSCAVKATFDVAEINV